MFERNRQFRLLLQGHRPAKNFPLNFDAEVPASNRKRDRRRRRSGLAEVLIREGNRSKNLKVQKKSSWNIFL